MNLPLTGWISTFILSDSEGNMEGMLFELAFVSLLVRSEVFFMRRTINRVLLVERRSLGHGDGEFIVFEPMLVFSEIV